MIANEPAIIVPNKKINTKIRYDGIGNWAKNAGNSLITPESVSNSLKIITAHVLNTMRDSNAEVKNGFISANLNLLKM